MPNRKPNETHGTNETNRQAARHPSPQSQSAHPPGFIPPHGGYENLLTYQKSQIIHQTNYLLDRQLKRLEQDFLNEGGLRERMTRARLAARARQPPMPPGHNRHG